MRGERVKELQLERYALFTSFMGGENEILSLNLPDRRTIWAVYLVILHNGNNILGVFYKAIRVTKQVKQKQVCRENVLRSTRHLQWCIWKVWGIIISCMCVCKYFP